jgi:hypothetical protein
LRWLDASQILVDFVHIWIIAKLKLNKRVESLAMLSMNSNNQRL